MFGYVNADKPNMLIKDYATYRAYYCGLCKSIGKRESQAMRLTVNYDITFLSLLAHNYCKTEPKFKETRCPIHPVGKKFSVVENNPVQERVVDVNTLLGYYKVYDDIKDGGSLKHKIGRLFLKGKYRRAAKRMPGLDKALAESYARLLALEREKSRDLVALTDTSAAMLKAVARAVCDNGDDLLDEFSDALGRWIYLIDAYDDITEDGEKGHFNPLMPEGGADEQTLQKIEETVRANLYSYIKTMRAAYDKMDITISEGPLSNVVYRGLKTRTDAILERRGKKCRKTLL